MGPLDEREQFVVDLIDLTRRAVMSLYGGNLDHPALDRLEAAQGQIYSTALEQRDRRTAQRKIR